MIFSRGIQLFISKDRPSINEERGIRFPCHCYAFPGHIKAISINLIWELVEDILTLVRFPNKQSSGSTGKVSPVILVKVSQKSYQKGLNFCTKPGTVQEGADVYTTSEAFFGFIGVSVECGTADGEIIVKHSVPGFNGS